MSSCCKSNCSSNSGNRTSNLGFFVAMFFVVALGGTAYLYFDATVFSPVDAQEQTALNNPGMGHPPKGKRPTVNSNATGTNSATTGKTRTDAEHNEN